MARRSTGFALLWTLALLVLAAVVLSDLSRRSARFAAEAVEAQDALQRKWALAGCRNVLLWNAEKIMQELEKEQRKKKQTSGIRSFAMSKSVGGVQIEVLVADEQAKANFNAIHRQHDGKRTAQTLGRLLTEDHPPIRLNPDPRDEAQAPAFGCWGQVFETNDPAELLDSTSSLSEITLWGDGRINLRRAPDQSVRAVLQGLLTDGQLSSILRARKKEPDETLEAWLATAELEEKKARQVELAVTDHSNCHSLLIRARSGQWKSCEQIVLDQCAVPAETREIVGTTQPAAPTSQPAAVSPERARVYRMAW